MDNFKNEPHGKQYTLNDNDDLMSDYEWSFIFKKCTIFY